MSASSDIARAKEHRATAKTLKDADAKRKFEEAADRLEKRAARGVSKVARRRRKQASASERR